MNKLIIHIGYPKALSSWMQKKLFVEEVGFKKIFDQYFCQLHVINPSPFNFNPDLPKEKISEFYASSTSENLVPVISAEALSGNMYAGGFNARQNADRLKEICPEAKIIIVTREQRSMARSLYKSWIVWGMPYYIDEIMNPIIPELYPQFSLDFLDFSLSASYYMNQFGKENVLVLPYEIFLNSPHEFIWKICSFSGAKTTMPRIQKLPIGRKINEGMPLSWLYFLLWQNRYIYKTPFNPRGFITLDSSHILTRIAKSKKNPLPKVLYPLFERRFSRLLDEHFGNHYAEGNRRLQDLTGIELAPLGYVI